MISKLTKFPLIAVLTFTVFAALPQLTRAQEVATWAPVGRLNITWNIDLLGRAFSGVAPVFAVEYEVEGSHRRFLAEAGNVYPTDGSSLAVYVVGELVGIFTVTDVTAGGLLLLDMFAHQKVPTVNNENHRAICYGSIKIVAGKF